jgi:small-conductance mechanosensitive channel
MQVAIWGDVGLRAWRDQLRRDQDIARRNSSSVLGFILRLTPWVIVFLMVLDNFGVNITALVASLGVGGIAVALAVQNILGDLFASLSIMLDKPFEIGDFIIVGDVLGSVEHIGLKTTRLRALGGEELIFSNADMLKSRIRNFRGVTERRSLTRLGVTYGTSPDTLARIPTILQSAVEKHPQARFDRAHFVAFGASGCEIELVYYVATTDYNEFLDIQQAVNLDILRSFTAGGIELAYPTQTLFVTKA